MASYFSGFSGNRSVRPAGEHARGAVRTACTAVRGIGLAALGLALAACADAWPSLEAGDPAAPATQPVQVSAAPAAAAGSSAAASAGAAASGTAVSRPTAVESAAAVRETFVGNKVSQMEGDLNRLGGAVSELRQRQTALLQETAASADQYHALLAEITSRLQRGTTPGNPVLVDYWNRAQGELEQVAETVPQMTTLSRDAADEAAFGQYLLNAVQATYGLSGAVDEDHIRLRRLEDSVHQQVVEIDRLLTDLSQDVNRQNTYVNNERQNMTTLSLAIKNGDLYGTSLATRSFQQTETLARQASRQAQPQPGERPLVIIKFDRPNVTYQQALYTAVSQALERKPTATFDLVAVSPQAGSAAQVALNSAAARRNAEGVLRTLTDMGVPASRVQLLAQTAAEAVNNEVHLYVR